MRPNKRKKETLRATKQGLYLSVVSVIRDNDDNSFSGEIVHTVCPWRARGDIEHNWSQGAFIPTSREELKLRGINIL